jgi:hypothetical protein
METRLRSHDGSWWLALDLEKQLSQASEATDIELFSLRCGSWDLRAKPSAPAAQFQHGRSLVTGLELLDPNRLASTSTEGTVCLWDIRGAFWTNQTPATFCCALCSEAASAQRVRSVQFVHDVKSRVATEIEFRNFALICTALDSDYCCGGQEMHFGVSWYTCSVAFAACMLLGSWKLRGPCGPLSEWAVACISAYGRYPAPLVSSETVVS